MTPTDLMVIRGTLTMVLMSLVRYPELYVETEELKKVRKAIRDEQTRVEQQEREAAP